MSVALFAFYLMSLVSTSDTAGEQCKVYQVPIRGKALRGYTYKRAKAGELFRCYVRCERDPACKSCNFKHRQEICEMNNETKETKPQDFITDERSYYIKRTGGDVDECNAFPNICGANTDCHNTDGSYTCICKAGYTGDGKSCSDVDECNAFPNICGANSDCHNTDGSHTCICKAGYTGDGKICSAWTLIARFSNNDTKNWMKDSGEWWYDKSVGVGDIADPSVNTDMLSPAFWLVRGREVKITRSDDPQHSALLRTTGDCLSGKTFRAKITSYGNFRNGRVWASDDCQGNCKVRYGGQFQATDGFGQAACDGSIQKATQVGFWCDWGNGDGAVLMIGGGGSSCRRADHGIGITETNSASFRFREGHGSGEYDFGDGRASARSKTYSLNLWIN
ncbi:uncharacterized protein [Acropora muricata]|uniref:uncharacterized protein n=1 Tax=Acropora muricata TaxID=159855 RepID=UPI0034E5C730